jgi:hypothetical protein
MDATKVAELCAGKTLAEQAELIEAYGRDSIKRFLSDWPRRPQTNKGNPYLKTGYNQCLAAMREAAGLTTHTR